MTGVLTRVSSDPFKSVLDLSGFHALPPGIRATTADVILRTRMHYVLRRDGSCWRIVFSQNTAVMPMPLPD